MTFFFFYLIIQLYFLSRLFYHFIKTFIHFAWFGFFIVFIFTQWGHILQFEFK